jgi:hypothetical protein
MLNTLRNLDTDTASAVLAVAALAFNQYESPVDVEPDRLRGAELVLSEIRERLKIRDNDNSPKALRAIDERLSDELDAVLLKDVDISSISNDLGARGALPIGAYNIQEGGEFKTGVKEKFSFAKSCVLKADDFEHLNDPDANDRQMSLFSKHVPGTNKGEPHWILVETMRLGDTISIGKLWRIFPSQVNVETVRRPLELLKAFVNHYGFPLSITGRDEQPKFIDSMRLPRGSSINALIGSSQQVIQTMIIGHMVDGTTLIRIAYAIDVKRYRADVTRFI